MALKVVGLAGSYNRPSKTFVLVEHIARSPLTAMASSR